MERQPNLAGRKLQIFQKMNREPQGRAGTPKLEFHAALVTGDLDRIRSLMDQFFQDTNVVFEISNGEMEWQVTSLATFGLSGLWTLEYKRELTTPLCIAAAHGHVFCVRHLLSHSADPDARPGGRGALHEACLGGHTACTRLLLQHGANPDLLSAEGLAPLHLCRTPASLGCAQALLEHGATVQLECGPGRDTPLHVAAQYGLDEHAQLYLGRGARVDARNARGETALSAACGAATRSPDEHARCLRLCALLLRGGAAADARDEDERSPLHKACGRARPSLCTLLLRHGADAGALDYGGASPLARALQTATCAPPAAPQRTVQALLNHGAPSVWPDAFPKVVNHVKDKQCYHNKPPGTCEQSTMMSMSENAIKKSRKKEKLKGHSGPEETAQSGNRLQQSKKNQVWIPGSHVKAQRWRLHAFNPTLKSSVRPTSQRSLIVQTQCVRVCKSSGPQPS